jgi:mannosyltransferase OCH1-like enzyme
LEGDEVNSKLEGDEGESIKFIHIIFFCFQFFILKNEIFHKLLCNNPERIQLFKKEKVSPNRRE